MSNKGTVLVSGGAGFVGSWLCERLVAEEWRVVCADSLVTGRRENIARLERMAPTRFRFVHWDICEHYHEELLADVADNGLDLVINLACPASPVAYGRLPLLTMRTGSAGTWNLLELAHSHKARFLMASTSEVYGDPLVHPQDESYTGNVNPLSPRGVYDESKRFSETLVFTYHRRFGLDVRIARIFNTYGPRMQVRDGRVVSNFVCQALRDEPLTVYGDGTQTRSFCYVSDTVDGLVRLAQADFVEPVNIGNPDEHTVKEFANLVNELVGSGRDVVYEGLPPDDPKVRCPDITRAREILGWEPKVTLHDGLRRTIEYFRERLGADSEG